MSQLLRAFLWRLAVGASDVLFAQGALPTHEEKRRRSTSALGTMLLAGLPVLVVRVWFVPATTVVWIVTGRGPGQRILALTVGGSRPGSLLVARAARLVDPDVPRESGPWSTP